MKQKNILVFLVVLAAVAAVTFRTTKSAPPEDIKAYLAQIDLLDQRTQEASEAFQSGFSTAENPRVREKENMRLMVERLPAFEKAHQSLYREFQNLKVPRGAEAHHQANLALWEQARAMGAETARSMDIFARMAGDDLSEEEIKKLSEEQFEITVEMEKSYQKAQELQDAVYLERMALEAAYDFETSSSKDSSRP
ncbi:MAG: hypothetical protein KC800_13580 [Candidatus Eremiobacteraeota bacterium]|nr:hypothetical protein [Candidatus Eremiobacteraeota bacterium]